MPERRDARKGPLLSGTSHPRERGKGELWSSQHIPEPLLSCSIPTGGWRRRPSVPSPHHHVLQGGMTRAGGQGLPTVQQEKPPRDLTGAGNASGSGCHEGEPSPGGQYSVPVGLSRSHGCWVAIILSSWSSKGCGRSLGGVGSWSGFLHGRRWLSLGTVLPPGAQKHLWDLCVWNQG